MVVGSRPACGSFHRSSGWSSARPVVRYIYARDWVPRRRRRILDAIRTHPAEAAESLAAVQLGLGAETRLTAASIELSAAMLHRDAAELWLQLLVDDGLVTAFVSALQARGVAIDADALADPDGEIPFEELEAFLPRARAFRCRVLKNGQVAGSGVLVGPSLVLTSCRRPPRPERAVGVRLSSGGADFDGSSERAVPR